jgi:hypothetical protein
MCETSARKQLFLSLLCALGIVLTTGFGEPSLAGTERYPDLSKANTALAPLCAPRWYISLGLGLDIDYQATDFVNTTDCNPLGAGLSYPANEHLRGHTYNDIFNNELYRGQVEAGYVLTPQIELFAMFKYAAGYGHKQYGDHFNYRYSIFDPYNYTYTNVDVTNELVAYPGTYKSWGGEVGLRYFFIAKNEPWHIRPYVSISGGATAVNHIGTVEWWYPPGGYSAGASAAFKGHLYDNSVVGTGAFLIGVEVPISCHWAVGLEGGVRYESQLEASNDIILNRNYYYNAIYGYVLPEGSTNPARARYNHDAGDRLYCPVTGYLKFRF